MAATQENRAGYWERQRTGYRAFIPRNLPPDPPLQFDEEMHRLLSDADRSLGRLDAASEILPNPDLFVAMYVRQEAVLSSQIEGTQSSLADVLAFEAGQRSAGVDDTREVLNYVAAMNHGIAELDRLPLSLRLIRRIHAELMRNVRGSNREPGEVRRSQNWIGPDGSALASATFVPPPVAQMKEALGALELFLHEKDEIPVLIHCALVHAQFETIHPFLDGNGRVGRLLITFQLVESEVLQRPLLYLSHYFKWHRAEYYDRLMAIRNSGAWEQWVKFFLQGVITVSREAMATARDILRLREQHLRLAGRERSQYAVPLLELLFERPAVTVRGVEQALGCTYNQANQVVARFEALGILRERTGQKRNRVYQYNGYLELFSDGTVEGPESNDVTRSS